MTVLELTRWLYAERVQLVTLLHAVPSIRLRALSLAILASCPVGKEGAVFGERLDRLLSAPPDDPEAEQVAWSGWAAQMRAWKAGQQRKPKDYVPGAIAALDQALAEQEQRTPERGASEDGPRERDEASGPGEPDLETGGA